VEIRIAPDELPEALAPRVTERRGHGAYRLALKDYVELETLMAALRAANVRVVEMEVMQPDLEEVFVQIMNKDYRVSE
jgi:ABC-2 type transport system ATP-binding protein